MNHLPSSHPTGVNMKATSQLRVSFTQKLFDEFASLYLMLACYRLHPSNISFGIRLSLV